MNTYLNSFFNSIGQQVAVLMGRVGKQYTARLDARLVAAGEPGDLRGMDLLGIQVVVALLFPMLWGFIISQVGAVHFLIEGPKQILTYAVLMVGGFLFPAMNVRERATKRQRLIAMQLPDTLDLLTLSVEAGLDFMSALRRVVQKHRPGPLKDELERFFKQTELGTARRVALREMADRVQLQDLSAVASALIQADRLGTSIGPILAAQSDMLRTRRAQRAEKAAQEAPVKMLAPLVMCIFPAVFLMVFSPIFIQMYLNMNRQ